MCVEHRSNARRRRTTVRSRHFVSLACLVLLVFLSVRGQSPNGTISGLVTDSSGAVIVGADVLLENDATGVQYSAKTNADGIYLLSNLPPGSYRLQVSKVGFETLIKPEIELNVQDALSINFTLPVGAASVTVTVEGGAPLLNTESASVGTVVDRQFVEDLPLNGRSFNTLLELTPGVVIAPSNTGEPGQFSISGQRTDANNVTVDGVSANFGVTGSLVQSGTGNAPAFSVLGGTSSLVSVDALQEFRIETSSFAPEFGRAPGGQIVLTTRSGTSVFHGGAFDYFRNTAMDANDWFAKSEGLARAPEHHNDFGGFLGGPILKNRTFFFFSYEGARLDLPQTSSTQVPSEYARSVASTALAPFLDAFPRPNDTTITPGVYTNSFTSDYANRATLNATSFRVDHTLAKHLTLFGRYNYAPSTRVTRGGISISPSSVASTAVNTQTATLGLTMMLNSDSSNNLRGNYSSQTFNEVYSADAFGGAVPPSSDTFLGGLEGTQTYAYFYPFDTALFIAGPYGTNGSRQMNVVDDFSTTHGKHQLKIGADYRGIFLHVENPPHKLFETTPSVQTFLASGQVSLGAETTATSRILSSALSVYGQDTWRITPRLTTTYGARWELSPAPTALGHTTLASWQNVGTLGQISLAPSGTAPWRTTYANLAPRLGLAYLLDKTNSLVLRVGAGVFYDLSVGSSAELAEEYPNLASTRFSGVSVPISNVDGYLPVISLQPPYPAVDAVAPNLELPVSYQWNVALEKAIGGSWALSGTYVGQAGRHLLRTSALYRPNPNFTSEFLLEDNDARSNYNALQIQMRGDVSSRLKLLANYTWSHSLDNISNDAVAGLSSNVISGASDYASSDFDVRQSFSGAITYSVRSIARWKLAAVVTSGWTVSSVIVARGSFPFNAQIFNFSLDPGGYALSRPDLVAGQPLWIYGTRCMAVDGGPCGGGQGLNPASFTIPTTTRQGTERRNDISGFPLTQVDLSVTRQFPITERVNVQFRMDGFNVLNHPNFTNPQALIQYGSFYLRSEQMLNQGLGGLNPIFQSGGPRSLQASLRIAF